MKEDFTEDPKVFLFQGGIEEEKGSAKVSRRKKIPRSSCANPEGALLPCWAKLLNIGDEGKSATRKVDFRGGKTTSEGKKPPGGATKKAKKERGETKQAGESK